MKLYKLAQHLVTFAIAWFFGVGIYLSFTTELYYGPDEKIGGHTITNILARFPVFLENSYYDWLARLNIDPAQKSDDIVLLSITDRSIQNLGRWPWSRRVHARITQKLIPMEPHTVVNPILFSEPEQGQGQEVSADQLFADQLKLFTKERRANYFFSYQTHFSGQIGPETFPPPIRRQRLEIPGQLAATDILHETWNIDSATFVTPTLRVPHMSYAPQDYLADSDGVLRRAKLIYNIDNTLLPSLPLAVAMSYTGHTPSLQVSSDREKIDLHFGKSHLYLSDYGSTPLKWSMHLKQFQHIDVWDLVQAGELELKKFKKELQGKIVVIAPLANGIIGDIRTPLNIDGDIPHTILVNQINSLIRGFKTIPPSTTFIHIILLYLCGLLLIGVLGQYCDPGKSSSFFLVYLILMGIYSSLILFKDGHETKLLVPLIGLIGVYIWNTVCNYYEESKDKKQIREAFGRYMSPAIVEKIIQNPAMLALGGENKSISVFFSDIEDFVSISESLAPEQLSLMLNMYLGQMTDIIFDMGGTLDKYIGDAIMAYWGAPIEQPDHAHLAVGAGLKMVESMKALNRRYKDLGLPSINIRIGINSGICSVGNMGCERIFNYTVVGKNVNLASRLEGLGKYYGTQFTISQHTLKAMRQHQQIDFKFRILDRVKTKGSEDCLDIYEVLDSRNKLRGDKKALADYLLAYELYRQREFEKAQDILIALSGQYPKDLPTYRLMEKCHQCLKNPPESNWDGVTIFQRK